MKHILSTVTLFSRFQKQNTDRKVTILWLYYPTSTPRWLIFWCLFLCFIVFVTIIFECNSNKRLLHNRHTVEYNSYSLLLPSGFRPKIYFTLINDRIHISLVSERNQLDVTIWGGKLHSLGGKYCGVNLLLLLLYLLLSTVNMPLLLT